MSNTSRFKFKLGDVSFETIEATQIWILQGVIHSLEYIGHETKLSDTEDKLRKLAVKDINKVIKTIKLK
jgi:hypothetical protein